MIERIKYFFEYQLMHLKHKKEEIKQGTIHTLIMFFAIIGFVVVCKVLFYDMIYR